jgi:hypothetical protein
MGAQSPVSAANVRKAKKKGGRKATLLTEDLTGAPDVFGVSSLS